MQTLKLPPATQRVYLQLQSIAAPARTEITLTRAAYLGLCHCKNIQAADRHLTRLKKANLLTYTTNQANISVQLIAQPEIPQPTTDAVPSVTDAKLEHLQQQIAELRELVRQLNAQLAHHSTVTPTAATPAIADQPARQTSPSRAATRRSRAKQASLYMGSKEKGDQTAGGIPPKPANPRHVAIAKAMLEECELLQDVQVFAETVPLEELRAIATRWRADPGTRTGGSLRYRIRNRHKPEWANQTKPLTMTEYLTPFVQRYRTPEEIARDEKLFAVPLQVVPEPSQEPVDETQFSTGPVRSAERNSPLSHAAQQGNQVAPSAGANIHTSALWQTVLDELSLSLPQGAYNTWVNGTYIVSHEEHSGQSHWIIGVPNAYAVDWLRSRLAQRIQRILASLTQQSVQIEFR